VLPARTERRQPEGEPVTLVEDVTPGPLTATGVTYPLAEPQAREVVAAKVSAFMHEHATSTTIVAGVSGGGDSNTLVEGLSRFAAAKAGTHQPLCFTLVFDPVWPRAAAERAAELCRSHQVPHRVLGPDDVARLLGMRTSLPSFFEAFSAHYGRNAVHFFGTFIISAVARALCREVSSAEYCLGFNREDVLAELLYSLLNGRRPLAFPVRCFGAFRLLMPVWDVPKRLLDACYPAYSARNYNERADTTTAQRSLIYYLAHGIEDVYPNLGLSLMQGIRRLYAETWSQLRHDTAWDLYVSEYAEHAEVAAVQEFLARHFNPNAGPT